MKAGSTADRSDKPSDGLAAETPSRPEGRLFHEMLMMFRITSPQHTKILLLGVALVFVIAATAFGQIRLNASNQAFYDALQRKDLHEFVVQLVVFCVIAQLELAALLATSALYHIKLGTILTSCPSKHFH